MKNFPWLRSILAGSALLSALLLFQGCATNPVTGEKELSFISESQEVQLGREYYGPTQQTQGGPYTTIPSLTTYVNDIGQRLAAVSDRPDLPYEFVVLNNGTPNAWALPGGKIAVNRGLLSALENEAELAAVLAHEVVHAAARHSAQQMERQTIGGAIATAAVIGVGSAVSDNPNRDLIMGAAHTSAALGAQLIFSKYGREAETQADYYGMQYMSESGYDPRAAVTLQEKFVKLSEGRNPNWLEGLFASHPPSQQRVEQNRETLASLPEGGRINREDYQSRIQPLLEAQPAYDTYQEAAKAFESGSVEQSLSLVNQAITLLPEESHFYGLKARLLSKQGNNRGALDAIETAINKNPEYFAFHMVEGQIQNELGNGNQAQVAFQRSNELLPTAESQAALGFLALEQGNEDRAFEFLSQAAQYSDTKAGTAARQAYIPLDMKRNPGKYLQARPRLNGEGMLQVVLSNQGPYPYEMVVFEVITSNQKRREIPVTRSFSDGEQITLNTGMGPFKPEISLDSVVRIQLVRAVME